MRMALPPGLYSLACSLEDHDACSDDGIICSCTCHWVAKAIRGA